MSGGMALREEVLKKSQVKIYYPGLLRVQTLQTQHPTRVDPKGLGRLLESESQRVGYDSRSWIHKTSVGISIILDSESQFEESYHRPTSDLRTDYILRWVLNGKSRIGKFLMGQTKTQVLSSQENVKSNTDHTDCRAVWGTPFHFSWFFPLGT